MLEIKKKKKEESYGFSTQEQHNKENSVEIEDSRKMSIDEMFTEKGFCFGKSYIKPTEHN